MIWDFLAKIVNFSPSPKQNHQNFGFLSISYQNLTSLWPKLPKSIPLPRLTLPKRIPLARLEVRKRVPLRAAHPQVPLLWKNPPLWPYGRLETYAGFVSRNFPQAFATRSLGRGHCAEDTSKLDLIVPKLAIIICWKENDFAVTLLGEV